jgi:L-fuconolactonase
MAIITSWRSRTSVLATVYITNGTYFRTDGPEELRCAGETEFAMSVADDPAGTERGTQFCAAVVSTCDLTDDPDIVARVLDEHEKVGRGRFRGIRQNAFWDPSPEVAASTRWNPPQGIYRSPKFRRGFAVLAARELSFDAIVFHPQLDEVVDLAREHPNTPIVLNHLGMPLGVGPYRNHREEVFAAWRTALARLAACDNVWMKLSGFGARPLGFIYHADGGGLPTEVLAKQWTPYIAECLAAFGADRCLFGSNFPVDRRAYDWVTGWNAMKLTVASCSADERRALFARTAATVYRIAVPDV